MDYFRTKRKVQYHAGYHEELAKRYCHFNLGKFEANFFPNFPKVAVPLCKLFVVARVILGLPFGSEKNRYLLVRFTHNKDNHNSVNNCNVIHPKMAGF